MIFKIEYLSTEADSLGRHRFFLNWVEPNGRKRSQVFFANPKVYGFDNEEQRTVERNVFQ